MSSNDKLYEFAVKVAGGSGCLFQPRTNEYTYVLTARHVVKDVKNLIVTRQVKGAEKNQQLVVIGKPFFLEDSDTDAAIIKVKFIDKLSSINRIDEINTKDINYYLIGHPIKRRSNKNDSYRPDPIFKIFAKPNGYLEAVVSPVPIKEEIDGMSGGGIIGVKDENYFLAGIQKEMSALTRDETLGRINFMPLSFFDEIIKNFPDKLLPIHSEQETTKTEVTSEYSNWLLQSNETFLVPVLDIRMPISLAWDEVVQGKVKFPTETESIVQQINRYHEWEKLAQYVRRESEIYAATDLTIYQENFVLTAGLGAGKSTLGKKLAAYLTGQGFIVLQVSLPIVARLLREKITFEQALREAALSNSGISSELAEHIMAKPDFLIADGLDECDPDRIAVANNIVSWSNGHSECRIWVMTRAVGHTKDLLPNFNHIELIPLDDNAIEKFAEKFIQAKISDNERQSILWSEFTRLVTDSSRKKQVASIASRNPLLLSFLLALFLDGKTLNGRRAFLYGQIINLIQSGSTTDRVHTINISSAVAERVAEFVAWQLINEPSIDKQTLITELAKDLQEQTGQSRIQAQQLVEQALLFWEQRQLIERLKIGSFEAYTFVHLSLAEYLAGRFIAGMDEETISHFIEKERDSTRWRQPILLASGAGAVEQIVKILLNLDKPENPISAEAMFAAAAINEAEIVDKNLVAQVIEKLRSRLTSAIPLLAIEAGQGLNLLAPIAPEFVAKATHNLLNHEYEWTRLAAFAARISAGHQFVTLSETEKWLNEFQFVRRFFFTQEPAETQITDLPEEAFELQDIAFTQSIDKILTEIEGDEAKEKIRIYLQKVVDKLTIELLGNLEKVLVKHDSVEMLEEAINEEEKNIRVFAIQTADDETRVKIDNEKEPDIVIIESIILAAGGSLNQDLKEKSVNTNRLELNQLLILTSGLELVHTSAIDYDALANTEKIDAFQEVLRAAIIALKLNPSNVLIEAKEVLAELQSSNNQPLYKIVSKVPVSINWENIKGTDLNFQKIAEALDHPSKSVKVPAALILLTGAGGNDVLPIIKQIFQSATQNSTFRVISSIIPDLFTAEEAVAILLERLQSPILPGFQYIYQALASLWNKVDKNLKEEIIKAILNGIYTKNPFIARGAAKALLKFQIQENPLIAGMLRSVFTYWTKNNDKTKQNPRALILQNLIRLNTFSLDDLIGLYEDLDFDVSKTALEAIMKTINNNEALLKSILGRIQEGLPPFKSSTALNLFNSLLELPSEQLKAVESILLDINQFKITAIRKRIVSLLTSEWISPDIALAIAQNALQDPSPSVRNTAVRTFRLLSSR